MQRIILYRSIYVLFLPVFLLMAIIACAGTALTGVASYTCPTTLPQATVTVLVGTPLPTLAPSATPFVILPPQDFYLGDDITIGDDNASSKVQLRLHHVQIISHTGTEQIVSWQLEVNNIGQENYLVLPAIQSFVSDVDDVSGTWAATQNAGDMLGIIVDTDLYTIPAGQTQTFDLAAFTPIGTAIRFSFQLVPEQATDSPLITWINQHNPHCPNTTIV